LIPFWFWKEKVSPVTFIQHTIFNFRLSNDRKLIDGWLVWLEDITWWVSGDRERVLVLWQILDNIVFLF